MFRKFGDNLKTWLAVIVGGGTIILGIAAWASLPSRVEELENEVDDCETKENHDKDIMRIQQDITDIGIEQREQTKSLARIEGYLQAKTHN